LSLPWGDGLQQSLLGSPPLKLAEFGEELVQVRPRHVQLNGVEGRDATGARVAFVERGDDAVAIAVELMGDQRTVLGPDEP